MRAVFVAVALVAVSQLTLAESAKAQAPQPSRPAPVTDPAEAGPDFQLQGEYAGWMHVPNRGTEFTGLQVVALGDGKFDAIEYRGGLPGNGWDRATKAKFSGEAENSRITFTDSSHQLVVADRAAVALGASGRELGRLIKMTRTSSTLGLAPPSGATVLFDGSSTDRFRPGAKATPDGLLMAGVMTKEPVQGFHMHLEFRTPYMPTAREQKRGNSGVYIQRRYEVQILDSFGLEPVFNGAGAIYRQTPPDLNMAFPPLTWQTYDIWFTPPYFYDDGKTKIANARVTVLHNGVPVHWNREITAKTGRGQEEGRQPLPIQIQSHKGDPKDLEGDPVTFRNIWIVPLDPAPYDHASASVTSYDPCRPRGHFRLFHRRRCG